MKYTALVRIYFIFYYCLLLHTMYELEISNFKYRWESYETCLLPQPVNIKSYFISIFIDTQWYVTGACKHKQLKMLTLQNLLFSYENLLSWNTV